MKQPGGHSGAERRRDQNEDEQRHAEIEVPVEHANECCRVGTVDHTPRKRCGQGVLRRRKNGWGWSNSNNTLPDWQQSYPAGCPGLQAG